MGISDIANPQMEKSLGGHHLADNSIEPTNSMGMNPQAIEI